MASTVTPTSNHKEAEQQSGPCDRLHLNCRGNDETGGGVSKPPQLASTRWASDEKCRVHGETKLAASKRCVGKECLMEANLSASCQCSFEQGLWGLGPLELPHSRSRLVIIAGRTCRRLLAPEQQPALQNNNLLVTRLRASGRVCQHRSAPSVVCGSVGQAETLPLYDSVALRPFA
jgi:hypothetical protein